MRRVVEPEILDTLPPGDPHAIRSRADLRRLNSLMDHAGVLWRAFRRQHKATPSHARQLRLVDLGAGDGTLLLRLARAWCVPGMPVQVTLLDRQRLVSSATRRAFAALRWRVECVECDVFDWLKSPGPIADVMLANLFLHHSRDEPLATLLRLAAARTNLLLACEPRRSPLALTAARSLFLLGCNVVTRHDAVASVRAGFAGHELSALWPKAGDWALSEHSVGMFSHCFFARRHV